MGRISDLLSALAAKALQTRALARAPIWLYRHDLGALLGGRMVLIEHTGRTTGEPGTWWSKWSTGPARTR